MDVEHLLVNLLHGHASTEDASDGEVTAVTWVAGAHHVLGVEHLLCELGNGQGTVLLGSSGCEWGKSGHEEVEAWEWDHVDGQLSEVRVELTWESEAGGDTGHGGGDEVVEVTVCWGGELEGSEADIVEGFVVNDEGFVSVFDELVDGEGGVVWFDDGVGHFWGWDDGECVHDTVWVFLTDLGHQKRSETGTGTTTEGVCELETLEAVAAFGLLADDVEDGIDELGSFCVVSLGPVIAGTGLSEDEVVWAEHLSVWSRSDGVHGSWLEVNEHSTGHVLATSGFVEVDIDALELEIGVSAEVSGGVETVFIGDDLPELGTDLVTALAGLEVDDFSHDG